MLTCVLGQDWIKKILPNIPPLSLLTLTNILISLQVQQVNNGMMAGAMQGAQAAFGNESIRNALFSMLGTDGTQSGVPSTTSRADV